MPFLHSCITLLCIINIYVRTIYYLYFLSRFQHGGGGHHLAIPTIFSPQRILTADSTSPDQSPADLWKPHVNNSTPTPSYIYLITRRHHGNHTHPLPLPILTTATLSNHIHLSKFADLIQTFKSPASHPYYTTELYTLVPHFIQIALLVPPSFTYRWPYRRFPYLPPLTPQTYFTPLQAYTRASLPRRLGQGGLGAGQPSIFGGEACPKLHTTATGLSNPLPPPKNT